MSSPKGHDSSAHTDPAPCGDLAHDDAVAGGVQFAAQNTNSAIGPGATRNVCRHWCPLERPSSIWVTMTSVARQRLSENSVKAACPLASASWAAPVPIGVGGPVADQVAPDLVEEPGRTLGGVVDRGEPRNPPTSKGALSRTKGTLS